MKFSGCRAPLSMRGESHVEFDQRTGCGGGIGGVGLAERGRSRIQSAGSDAVVTTSIAAGAEARATGAVRAQWPGCEHRWAEQCAHSWEPTAGARSGTLTLEPCWCVGRRVAPGSAMAKQGWLTLMASLARGISQLAPTSAKSIEAALDRKSVIRSSYPPPLYCTRGRAARLLSREWRRPSAPSPPLDSEAGSKPDESR
jgi:hypothetical protein